MPSPTSRQLANWDHQYLWHPFTQMKEWTEAPPLIIDRGEGPYLIDNQGKQYLDGVSSLWVNIHGHRHPAIDQAIRRQLNKIAHSTLLGLSSPPAIQLARELVKIAPPGLTRVFYSDDGSTAVEVALKMAVQYWQQTTPAMPSKTHFVHMRLSYHGDTAGGMSIGGIELFHNRFQPLLFPTLAVDAPYCYRCPLQQTFPSCQIACLDQLESLLTARHHDIAAVVVEPLVQGVAGMITAPSGHLSRIRELCTQHQVLMVADEVATGFGRTGRMFACEHESITPDLLAVAKGLTGGYLPLAATLVTEEMYQAFLGDYHEGKTLFHGHSFTGNALGCAAALANLQIFRTEHTLRNVQKRIPALQRHLQALTSLQHVGDIRQSGYMVGIELVKDQKNRIPFPLTDRMGHKVTMECQRKGLLIRPIGNVLVLMPPLSAEVKHLKKMATILKESICIVTEPKKKKAPL
ncbi:MAG: adenosylmethionine--8-amino-7-oxononanoate transaminase [Nitrospirales bacterium]|nr:adenosylmethionine--8-amino-7-oxononanoate transaminase [Nitrospirales bacterium]